VAGSAARLRCPLAALVALVVAATCLAGCSTPRGSSGSSGKPTAFVSNMMLGNVTVLDLATQKAEGEVVMPRAGARLPFPGPLAALPDGSKVYVANLNAEALVAIDVASMSAGARIPLQQVPQEMAVTPDGRLLFVANDGTAVIVVDSERDAEVGRIEVGAPSAGAAMAPDGSQAWFSTAKGVVVVDVASRSVAARLPEIGSAASLVFSPDGGTVYVLGNFDPQGVVWVVDVASRALRATIVVDSSPVAAAVTPDGRWLYIVNRGANLVSAIDTSLNDVVARLPVGTVPVDLAIHPDGSAVYVTDSVSNTLSVISPASQAVVATIALETPAPSRPSGIAIVRVP